MPISKPTLAAKLGYENTEIHLNSFNSDYPYQVTLGMAAEWKSK